MGDLQPNDDLKPDVSDRRPVRKSAAAPGLAVSRQHLMLGMGILVLLLLIFGIGSALKAPTPHEVAQQQSGAREINLAGTSALTTRDSTVPGAGSLSDAHDNSGVNALSTPQSVSAPPVTATPTESPVVTPPEGQRRIELPGGIADALMQQQGAVGTLTQQEKHGTTPTLPTAAATVAPSSSGAGHASGREATRPVTSRSAASKPATATTAPDRSTSTASQTAREASRGNSSVLTAPASHFTLQLSGASKAETLRAFAGEQKLGHFSVYETKRNGQPWFVLVSGNYASREEAKKAIATLPAEVQAKNPWVKPIHQVQQDLKK